MKASSTELTKQIAEKLAKTFTSGKLIFLIGDLGAGKTHFAKGIAKGLGVKKEIVSPTFVIMNRYKGRKFNLVHIDLYRIEDFDELNFDISESINEDSIVIIEWADKFISHLPKPDIIINIDFGDNDYEREININHLTL